MITDVIMPKLGETMEEGTIARWAKKEGDEVKKGEVLLEITTDKATLEVESYASGILKKIIANEGEIVPVTEIIAFMGDAKDEITQDKISAARERIEKKTKEAAPQAGTAAGAKAEAVQEASPAEGGRVAVSPRAKRLAQEKGIDISRVKGSGPGGRIVEEDILNYIETAPKVAAPKERGEFLPLTPMRKFIADRMTVSQSTIPHYYESLEVDMGECIQMKKDLATLGHKVSYNDFLVRASALSLKMFPMINNSWTPNGIKVNKEINVGVAVSLDDDSGLIIPVIKNTDTKTLPELAAKARELVEKARTHKLTPDEFSGGTFTVTNLGMFDIERFIALIYPGESAILAVGRMVEKPVVKAGQIVIRHMLTLTISADHRIIDGVLVAKFLQKIKELLEKPIGLK